VQPFSWAPSADDPLKDVHAVFKLPPSLLATPQLDGASEACRATLLRLFGDIPRTLADAGLLEKFKALPPTAAVALAASDELQAPSEDGVLVGSEKEAGYVSRARKKRDVLIGYSILS
jgi:hypothetical protein